MTAVSGPDLETRARQSRGASDLAIYRMAAAALARRNARGDVLVDVGCGSGQFRAFVRDRFSSYIGVDAVAYDGFPDEGKLHRTDLNAGKLPLPADAADAVVAIETIEHLENPRAFVRELVRVVRPGGWVAVTTPNQLSVGSLLTLIVRRRFAAFQDVDYPAHITSLLEVDLTRIAAACDLHDIAIEYSLAGRILLTRRQYPERLARLFPRGLSDNLLVIGRKES